MKSSFEILFSTNSSHAEIAIAIPQADCFTFSDAGVAGAKCPLTYC